MLDEGPAGAGLRDADFKISEDGKRQGVTLFSGERRPLRLALALDVSRSMDNKIRQVEEALRHFIDLLEPADEILVMTFSDRLWIAQDFTSDRHLLARTIDNLEVGGGTALYDAAFEAIRRVASGPAESKAIVLVTDGVDTASTRGLRGPARVRAAQGGAGVLDRPRQRRARSTASSSPPPITGGPGGARPGWPRRSGPRRLAGWRRRARGLAGGREPGGGPAAATRHGTGRRAFDDRPLMELADDTGGRAEIVKGLQHYAPGRTLPGGDRLKQAVESIAMTLRHRYLLGYEPPRPSAAGTRSASRSTSPTRRRAPARATTPAADHFARIFAPAACMALMSCASRAFLLHLLGRLLEARIGRAGLDELVELGKRVPRGRSHATEALDDRFAHGDALARLAQRVGQVGHRGLADREQALHRARLEARVLRAEAVDQLGEVVLLLARRPRRRGAGRLRLRLGEGVAQAPHVRALARRDARVEARPLEVAGAVVTPGRADRGLPLQALVDLRDAHVGVDGPLPLPARAVAERDPERGLPALRVELQCLLVRGHGLGDARRLEVAVDPAEVDEGPGSLASAGPDLLEHPASPWSRRSS